MFSYSNAANFFVAIGMKGYIRPLPGKDFE